MVSTVELQALLVRLGTPRPGDRLTVELDAWVAHALVTELLASRRVPRTDVRECFTCWRTFEPRTPDTTHCDLCVAYYAARETT